ncbi:cytochrome b5 domain-containing protein [Latilactobacillus sakei]
MTDKIFTKETLAQYNGQDGQPSYVAVEGIVYDLSAMGPWEGGKHFKGLRARTRLNRSLRKLTPHT